MALVATTRRFELGSALVEVSVARADWCGVDEAIKSHVLDSPVDQPTGEALVEWIHSQLAHSPIGPDLLGVALQQTNKNRFVSAQSNGHLL